MRALLVVGLLAATACTEKNPAFCGSDAECTTSARPICDTTGEFEGTANVCIPIPDDCPLERCGCTPGEPLACDLDQLTSCAPDGKTTVTSTCALGCSTEDRCLTFEPSNGLGPALEMAALEDDVVVPDGAEIDTDLGVIRTSNGEAVTVTSLVVSQSAGPDIRVFIARSFVIDSVATRGSSALAFVAAGALDVKGRLDASANGQELPGPGARKAPDSCFGQGSHLEPPLSNLVQGGGGGGNATKGGLGGGTSTTTVGDAGGLVTGFALAGGCGSGLEGFGGTGGGAVQLVSSERVRLSTAGLVDVGGGGGAASEGGGSGGLVIIEAPVVSIEGAASGIAANGAAGGGCGQPGPDATSTTTPAVAPKCAGASAGDGATIFDAPGAGEVSGSGPTSKGGGGGAVGRARIVTKSGEFSSSANPIVSAAVTKVALTPK